MSQSPLEPPTLWRKQDWAYTNVRRWILDGTLSPGERLEQEALASKLGISRVPLRQALNRLYAEGLVFDRPHQKCVVAPVSLNNARDVYAGREALEVLLARHAAAAITAVDVRALEEILANQEEALQTDNLELARAHDRAFHQRIYEVADMERTLQALQQLRALSDRYIAMYMSDAERSRASMAEHRGILDALRDRDCGRVADLVGSHVRGGIETLEELLSPDAQAD